LRPSEITLPQVGVVGNHFSSTENLKISSEKAMTRQRHDATWRARRYHRGRPQFAQDPPADGFFEGNADQLVETLQQTLAATPR
jgi:hypothetical protein